MTLTLIRIPPKTIPKPKKYRQPGRGGYSLQGFSGSCLSAEGQTRVEYFFA
jgi:hypothetical protein